MKRAVITGLGIVSCLGNDKASVAHSLREGISGIRRLEDFAEMGLRCNVGAVLDIDPKDHIDRKILRFMGPSASYAYIATERAIADAGLTPEMVSNHRTGLVMGSGGVSGEMFTESIDVMRCNVGAVLDIDPKDHIDRKILRFMGPSASYAYIATERAIADAGLTPEMVSNHRTGLVMGSGGVSGEILLNL
jgi:3-oxoacyl-(acyl-carrier-protein) synthase